MAMTLQTDYPSAPPAGYSGQLIGATTQHDIQPARNVEATLSIPFGRGVCWDLTSPVSDYDVQFPAAQADLVAGIVIHLDNYSRAFSTNDITNSVVTIGDLDGVGLRPQVLMAILRRGYILVTCDSGCAVGDRLFVRSTVNGLLTVGGLGNAADSTNMIDCTKQGQWLSSAAAGGLAQLYVDFSNKP